MTTVLPNRYRALFISDLHLGSSHCKATRLLDFLKITEADRIYLVGDVFDSPSSILKLPSLHQDILRELARKAFDDAIIIYIPGNHDSMFRTYIGRYGSVRFARRYVHIGKLGGHYLVTHGDETDILGIAWFLKTVILLERIFPISLWEVCRAVVSKTIIKHTQRFKLKMDKESVKFDGVICGHVHFPYMTDTYMNCGDWTHHCTAIVEHYNGVFELLKG
jgi:UDP-2,3-diacylglucosamine pyrophosphatase LpxH